MKKHFFTNKKIPKELLADNFAYLCMVCSAPLNIFEDGGQFEDKKEVAGLKKLPTAVEHLRNGK